MSGPSKQPKFKVGDLVNASKDWNDPRRIRQGLVTDVRESLPAQCFYRIKAKLKVPGGEKTVSYGFWEDEMVLAPVPSLPNMAPVGSPLATQIITGIINDGVKPVPKPAFKSGAVFSSAGKLTLWELSERQNGG